MGTSWWKDASKKTCTIRDQAQRPSVVRSTPSTAVSSHQLNCAQLNLTRDQEEPHLRSCTCLDMFSCSTCWNHQKPRKERRTTPKVMCLPGHVFMQYMLKSVCHILEQRWKKMKKGCCRSLQLQNPWTVKRNQSPNSGHLFNATTVDKVRSVKWPTVALYLDELLSW